MGGSHGRRMEESPSAAAVPQKRKESPTQAQLSQQVKRVVSAENADQFSVSIPPSARVEPTAPQGNTSGAQVGASTPKQADTPTPAASRADSRLESAKQLCNTVMEWADESAKLIHQIDGQVSQLAGI
jgi:hypothetical protein